MLCLLLLFPVPSFHEPLCFDMFLCLLTALVGIVTVHFFCLNAVGKLCIFISPSAFTIANIIDVNVELLLKNSYRKHEVASVLEQLEMCSLTNK